MPAEPTQAFPGSAHADLPAVGGFIRYCVGLGLLLLVALSFAAPSWLAYSLRTSIIGAGGSFQDASQVYSEIILFFGHGMEENPFSWLFQYWSAIPSFVGGLLVAAPRSKKLTGITASIIVVIALIVAIWGSVELVYWGELTSAQRRSFAASIPGSVISNVTYLSGLYEQVEKTRDISVAIIAAVGGVVIGLKPWKQGAPK